MTDELSSLADDELIARFAATAKVVGAAVLNSDVDRTDRAIRRLWAIEAVLRARGPTSRMKLVRLLDDRDRFVRYYAAYHLLALVPERARAIIEWNAKFGFDALAGDAGMTLRNLDTGFYKPD
jgi:hypothetical protein